MTMSRRALSFISTSARCQCNKQTFIQSQRSFHSSSSTQSQVVELQPVELVGSFASSAQGKILNTVLPERQPVCLALQSIYGIGEYQSRIICGDLGLNPHTPVNQLPMTGFFTLRQMIESRFDPKHLQQKELGKAIMDKIRIGSYQGVRHTQMLPVRGQRTQTNAKNVRKFARLRAAAYQLPIYNRKKAKVVKK